MCKLYNATAVEDDPDYTPSHASAGCCVDFTVPFLRSGIAIMKKIENASPVQQLGSALLDPFIMSCLCVLILGMILVGCLVFFYENWMMTGAFHGHWQDGRCSPRTVSSRVCDSGCRKKRRRKKEDPKKKRCTTTLSLHILSVWPLLCICFFFVVSSRGYSL